MWIVRWWVRSFWGLRGIRGSSDLDAVCPRCGYRGLEHALGTPGTCWRLRHRPGERVRAIVH